MTIGGRREPARRAATRPTVPAFAVCVCRICGRSRLISRASRIVAARSRSGEISRPSSSMRTTSTPSSSATNAIESSPRASDPATSVVSYPRSRNPAVRYATCSAGPPIFRRAMTRKIFTRRFRSDAGKDCLGGELEPRREVDPRLVAERLPRRGDVGPGVADVPRAWRLEALLDRLAEDDADALRDMVDARRRSRRYVEDPPARSRRIGSADRCVHNVADVREVAGLLTVAVDGDRLAQVDRRDEERHDRGALGVRALPRPEHVEVAEDDGLE